MLSAHDKKIIVQNKHISNKSKELLKKKKSPVWSRNYFKSKVESRFETKSQTMHTLQKFPYKCTIFYKMTTKWTSMDYYTWSRYRSTATRRYNCCSKMLVNKMHYWLEMVNFDDLSFTSNITNAIVSNVYIGKCNKRCWTSFH